MWIAGQTLKSLVLERSFGVARVLVHIVTYMPNSMPTKTNMASFSETKAQAALLEHVQSLVAKIMVAPAFAHSHNDHAGWPMTVDMCNVCPEQLTRPVAEQPKGCSDPNHCTWQMTCETGILATSDDANPEQLARWFAKQLEALNVPEEEAQLFHLPTGAVCTFLRDSRSGEWIGQLAQFYDCFYDSASLASF